MIAIATPVQPPEADPDQRIVMHGVSWQQFEAMLAIRGDSNGVRMTYLEGELELMSPSRSHEGIKTTIGRMLEAWALRSGIVFEGFGSWTLKSAPKERGAEPDECYIVDDPRKELPDLAIEVAWTRGGLDKLEVYRGLGVAEVWIWRDDVISVFCLRGETYEQVQASAALPDVDVALLARCLVDAKSQTEAVKLFLERSIA